ncbi:glycosyltransferase [Pontiellaceae bacterium B12219]|nr:glycosyltransferase [Pontiellaceae bacterium B12219]
MKVCDIVQFYSALSGGVKRYIDDKARYFATQPDIEHVVIVPSDRNAIRSEGCTRIYEIKSHRVIFSDSYRLLISIKRISDIIKSENPDLIEVGDPYHTAWIAHSIARRANIPVVAYYHSDYPRAFGRTLEKYCGKPIGRMAEKIITFYLKRLYNRMNATIVATGKLKKVLADIGIERIIQVPLGTDINRFHPIDQRAQVLNDLGLSNDWKLLLYVGRMAREKNVLNLTKMMAQFPEHEKIALLLVGDGEQGDEIQNLARRHANIFWHPYCSSPELLSVFYSAADVFVHPGTNETFGLVSLEAQACGAPVVAVKGGGVDATLKQEPVLHLAENASPCALKKAVARQLDRNEHQHHRAERRQRVIHHYGRDTTCGLLVDLYEVVLAEYGTVSDQPEELILPQEIPGL